MSSDVVTTERIGSALVATIDRESSGNAISREVVAGLAASVREAESAEGLAAFVVTGRGGKFFAAGGDLKQYREIRTRSDLADAFAHPRALMDAMEALPVPVIAAINGYALGGGAELALAADLRIASENARIGFPYVKLGLVAGWDGMERLARCCGYGHAMHLLLTGEAIGAAQAERIGLVNEVVSGDVLERALSWAERFSGYAPLALHATKTMLRRAFTDSAASAREEARARFADLWISEDHREAEAAFVEKRRPRFSGR